MHKLTILLLITLLTFGAVPQNRASAATPAIKIPSDACRVPTTRFIATAFEEV